MTVSFDTPVLRATRLRKTFRIRRSGRTGGALLRAVDDVSFELAESESLAIVGESGCGKSTTARMVMKLMEAESGSLHYAEDDVTHWSRRRMRRVRPLVQMVFQDPFSSVDPRFTVSQVIAEPLRINGRYTANSPAKIDDLLDRVGLSPDYGDRHASALSGGQRQRLGIARALALEPRVLVLDEPVSALDASIQAQVLNLFADLKRDLGLSYLFIAHDLSVVRHIADRVAVMYVGKIVESGPVQQIFERPQHPYTHGLVSAIPLDHPAERSNRPKRLFSGEVADPIDLPSGCHYRSRCYQPQELCSQSEPRLEPHEQAMVACHFAHVRELHQIRPVSMLGKSTA